MTHCAANFHGPENAEHEIRKAYREVMDSALIFYWDRKAVPGVSADEALTLYKYAYQAYRKGDKLAAERWARATKHLSRAFQYEAKIAFIEPRAGELPVLEGARPEELGQTQQRNTTADLLNSVAHSVPAGLNELPEEMKRYLSRAQRHLGALDQPDYPHELLRVARIMAAYEYGRVLECMALAYEAEAALRPKAA